MNKKISYGCLIFCMALYSANTFAAKRNTTRANTTTKTRSSSLVSGYSNKYFKSPSITLVEKRSVELAPLMFTENIANIKKTLSGSTAVEPKYRLCIPCESIYLTYNDGVINDSLKGDSQGEGNCYSLNADTPNEYYKLSVKSGAIEACGDKLRMTIIDMRNNDVHTEVDSVVLNIVPNSSLYDYSNIKLGQDTEIYDLIKNYTEAKRDAKTACNGDVLDKLKTLRNLLIGSTTTSAISTVTGGIDTALQTKNTIDMSKRVNNSGESKYDQAVNECFEDVIKELNKSHWKTKCDCSTLTGDDKTKCEQEKNECNYKLYECERKSEKLKVSKDEQDACMKQKGCAEKTDKEERYNCEQECYKKGLPLSGSEKASIALSAVSATGNLTTMGLSIGAGSQVNSIIDKLKACKAAAEKMHTAGMALEAGLEEIMSADE